MDYIPPQLDADMLGPGPCTVRSFPQPNVSLVNSHVDTADNRPTSEQATNISVDKQEGATIGFAPFANGPSKSQVRHHPESNDNKPCNTTEWLSLSEPSPEARGPHFVNDPHYTTQEQQSVGKFIVRPESVELQAAISQTRMNVAPATGVCGPSISEPPVTMCPTIEQWCDNSLETIDTAPRVPSLKCDTSTTGSTSERRLSNSLTSAGVPSACTRTRSHRGEDSCHRDSKCITCREKPPPNQVCTALPVGERNELDEALYRCAVGSILGMRSLTSQVNGHAKSSTLQSPQPVPLQTQATNTLENPFSKVSAGLKSANTSRDNSLSAQRRMAMARKERQREEAYLSSSSESSSDSEGKIQRKRRRKVARKSISGAPPNRICTAVPLMDRTLPLPCLTKDLDFGSYFDENEPSGQQLLSPVGEFPQCLPSPVSLERLSSPEPQSSASEHPEYSSSSYSDLSDFESIPPPASSNCRYLPHTSRTDIPAVAVSGRNTATVIHRPVSLLQRQCSIRGEAVPVTDNNPTRIMRHGRLYSLCTPSSNTDCMKAPQGGSPNEMAPHSSQTMHPAVTQGVLSSVPLPFELQLEPATLSDNSDKQVKSGVQRGLSSAGDENRQNQTCDILSKSRRIGEICSSPASPWSDSSLTSSHLNQTSPSNQPIYPHLDKVSNNSRAFACTHASFCSINVKPAYAGNTVDRHSSNSHVGYTRSQPPHASNTDTNRHGRPHSVLHNHQANMSAHLDLYPPSTQTGHLDCLHANSGEKPANSDLVLMRSLERGPPADNMQIGASYTEAHQHHNVDLHAQASHHYTAVAQPPERWCTSAADVAYKWTVNVNNPEQFSSFGNIPPCNY
ncbi:uncharacterized protein LOC110984887 isoform X2 [Acanthaster planci]|nr:uncharacterized protein LOC110984887 isoform X2 [Acanthaster planci]